jgi:hypothetical protein
MEEGQEEISHLSPVQAAKDITPHSSPAKKSIIVEGYNSSFHVEPM